MGKLYQITYDIDGPSGKELDIPHIGESTDDIKAILQGLLDSFPMMYFNSEVNLIGVKIVREDNA